MKSPDMIPVYSSHIQKIGYDKATGDLHVQFSNGKCGVYAGVPADVAEGITTAASVGQALRQFVRGKHEFRYVEEEDDKNG